MSISLNNIKTRYENEYMALQAWYKFDNVSDIYFDSSGNKNLLSQQPGLNIPLYDSNNYKIGKGSIKIDDSSRIFNINLSKSIYDYLFESGITIAFWLCLTIPTKSSSIITFSETNTSLSILTNETNNTVYFQYSYETDNVSESYSGLIDGKWHHLAWSISKTGKWNIYIDNVNQNVNRQTSIQFTPGRNYTIGGSFPGNIDDFRIYSKVLTANTIDVIYNSANVNNIFVDNGKVGIGTNVMNDAHKLTVNGAINASNYLINGSALKFWNTSNNFVYTLNNVGIGTQTPSEKLEVYGGDLMVSGGDIVNNTTVYQPERWKDSDTYYTGSKYIYYSDGNVAIGTTSTVTSKLHVVGNVLVSNGEIISTSNITGYDSTISDDRLKTRIGDIENAVEGLNTLSTFKYKTDNLLAVSYGFDSNIVQLGLSAQEVEKVFPEVVKIAGFDIDFVDGEAISKSGENYLTVSYEKIVPILVKGIQELYKKYEDVVIRINRLKNK